MCRLAWPACLILVLLAGCAIHRAPEPQAQSIVLSDNLAHGVPAWEKEAKKRFEHPILLVCHGNTERGEWRLYPDRGGSMSAESVARLLKKLYPGRPIVLIACNPDHLSFHVSGVYYARKLVSSIPGWGEDEWVESIGEFEEGK